MLSVLWDPNMSAALFNKVFLKQKKIIRIIHNAHTDVLFKQSKILKLSKMVEMEILKTVYR